MAPAGKDGRRKNPGEANGDRGDEDGDTGQQEVADVEARIEGVIDDEAQLQADIGENEGFEQGVDGAPELAFLHTLFIAGLRAMVPEGKAGGDHREHA